MAPAGAYLDIIRDVREATLLPISAYQVSVNTLRYMPHQDWDGSITKAYEMSRYWPLNARAQISF